ncbi:MAG: hydrogenase maturation protease [Candidatus Bathyarchaeia archaeon]
MRILIGGVGNILRGDDGLGPLIIQRLNKTRLPKNVDALDLGTSGMEVLYYLQGYDKAILIDSIKRGEKPGTVYHMTFRCHLENLGWSSLQMTLGAHEIDLNSVLKEGTRLGMLPPTVVILGCEPRNVKSFRIGLSREVEAAVPKLLELAVKEAKED